MEWITDSNGNRCSVAYWGSRDAAQAALDSLESCSGCSDCSDCSGCSRCSRCSGCSDCSHCSHCSGCSGCSGCSDMPPAKSAMSIPVIEHIHQKVYAAASQPGCLNMSLWHTCETTHCRAGWVVTLAGEEGKRLEEATSTLFAAMQIYKASDPVNPISPVRFYDSNEKALADMKRLAEAEIAQ